MTIWLLRHGESVGNRDGLFSGVYEHPLTELGRRQAHQAGEEFSGRDFDRVYTSGLRRAIETADIFLAVSGARVGAREVRTELNERNFGNYEAQTQPPMHKLVEGDIAWQICRDVAFVPPGGESMLQTHTRAVAFLEMARQAPGETLIVAHGNVLRSMALHHLGWPPELLPDMPSRNCLITRIVC